MTPDLSFNSGNARKDGEQPFRILIIGAGLAGLAAAIGLRGPGREVTVLEASGLKSEVGAAICCPPNALKILRKWGLKPDHEGGPTQGKVLREINLSDETVMTVPTSDRGKGEAGIWYFYHRQDLHGMLRSYAERKDLAGLAPKIVCGAKVESADCSAGTVKTQAGDIYTADLIVGADGIHSKIREAILGESNAPQPSGHSAYRMLVPKERVNGQRTAEILKPDHPGLSIVIGGDRRVIFYPCREASILNVVAISPDKHLKEESQESWIASGSLDDLLATFHDFPPWVLDVFRQADKPALYQLRAQKPLNTWHKGRAIIIGDAAHAMLPHQAQGAAQAIEDAEALWAMFQDFGSAPSLSEIELSLELVQKARYERASLIQEYSRQKAMPMKDKNGVTKLNSSEFADYNWNYDGANAWLKKQTVA